MTYPHPGELATVGKSLDRYFGDEIRHSTTHLVQKPHQFARCSLDNQQDPPVRQVLYESVNGEIGRDMLHGIAETDALNPPGEVNPSLLSCFVWHYASKRPLSTTLHCEETYNSQLSFPPV